MVASRWIFCIRYNFSRAFFSFEILYLLQNVWR